MNNDQLTKQVLLKVKRMGGKLTPEELNFLNQQEGSDENATKRNYSD